MDEKKDDRFNHASSHEKRFFEKTDILVLVTVAPAGISGTVKWSDLSCIHPGTKYCKRKKITSSQTGEKSVVAGTQMDIFKCKCLVRTAKKRYIGIAVPVRIVVVNSAIFFILEAVSKLGPWFKFTALENFNRTDKSRTLRIKFFKQQRNWVKRQFTNMP